MLTKDIPNVNELRKQLDIIFGCAPGAHEIRVIGRYYYSTLDGKKLERVLNKDSGDIQAYAIYLAKNPKEAEQIITKHFSDYPAHNCYMALNRVSDQFKLKVKPFQIEDREYWVALNCTKIKDIQGICALIIDLDREVTLTNEQGVKLAASPEELKALDLGRQAICQELEKYDLKPNYQIMSGNGYQIIYFFPAQTDTIKTKKTITSILEGLKQKYIGIVSVDTAMSDPARVARLCGVWNKKPERAEDKSQERVYRIASFLDGQTKLNSYENIEKLAYALQDRQEHLKNQKKSKEIASTEKTSQKKEALTNQQLWIDKQLSKIRLLDVLQKFYSIKITCQNNGKIQLLCPYHDDHSPSAWIDSYNGIEFLHCSSPHCQVHSHAKTALHIYQDHGYTFTNACFELFGTVPSKAFSHLCENYGFQNLEQENTVISEFQQKTTVCHICKKEISFIYKPDGNSQKIDLNGLPHYCNRGNLANQPVLQREEKPEDSRLAAIEKSIAEDNKIDTFEFPLYIFPTKIQAWLQEIAETLQVPVDFAACALLPVSGMLLAPSTIQLLENWREHPNIYLAICAETGAGKTPAISKVMKVVFEIEKALAVKYESEKIVYELALENYKNTPIKVRKAIEKPTKPKQLTIFTTNATVEALGGILQNNPGILLCKDELTGWVKSMNQYKGGRGDDSEFFLSAWSGTPVKIDRASKDSTFIESACLSILGGVVPENILVLVPETKDGFVERILFTYPQKRKRTWPVNKITQENKEFAESLLLSFWQKREREYHLSQEALPWFVEYYEKIHGQIDEIIGSPHIKGFMEKLISYAARFMLILNALHQRGDAVEQDIVHYAIVLADYFLAHTKKAHQELVSSKEIKETNAIYEWAKRKNIKIARIRTLVQAMIPGCSNTEKTKKKAQELIDMDLAKWTILNKEIEFIF